MTRPLIILGTLFLVLGTVNGLILSKERTLDEGTSILLPLAGGSLTHDDCMALQYRLARQLPAAALQSSGHLVVSLDGSGVASFRRIHRGEALLSDELLLFYRKRGGLRLGAETFYFRKGEGERYAGARFAELKVNREGRSVLVGLRNAELGRL